MNINHTFQKGKLLATATLMFVTSQAVAQKSSLSGIVTDAQKEPAIGATIQLPDFGLVAVTDAQGRYKISTPPQW